VASRPCSVSERAQLFIVAARLSADTVVAMKVWVTFYPTRCEAFYA